MTQPLPSDSSRLLRRVGWGLTRLLVPAWVLTGAGFKLLEANPGLLPRNILLAGDKLGMDLDVLLAILIGLEIFAAAVMLFIARLARPMAIFMLSVFCLVLVGEMARGNTSCGCLGGHSPPPWLMLVIDGGLLLGVILLGRGLGRGAPAAIGRGPVLAAGAMTVAGGVAVTTMLLGHTPIQIETIDPAPESVLSTTSTGPVQPEPITLPSYWFTSDLESWVGRPYRDLELVSFMKRPPADLDAGEQYLVFYSRTCDHCEEMFDHDFVEDPGLAARVLAVEVPESPERLTSPDAWPMPDTQVRHATLPLGVNWIITTPLTLRLEDGIVRCATEGDHTECMGLPPHEH